MMQAVQVIIERLKTNPEDFFGDLEGGRLIGRYSPRFQEITEKLDDLLTEKENGHIHRLWYLEPEEKEALLSAYKEARRARFEAKTFHQLLTRQEKEETSTVTYKTAGRYNTGMRLDSTGNLGVGTAPNPWGNVIPKEDCGQVEYYVHTEVSK
jgi:hypothetical protein